MSDCRFGVSPVNYPDPDPDDLYYGAYPMSGRGKSFLDGNVCQFYTRLC